MNGIFLAILLTSATPWFEAATLDGRTLVGTLEELSAQRAIVATETGRVTVPTAQLLTVSARQENQPVPGAAGVVVELIDGSVIRGSRYITHGDQALVTLARNEVIQAPVRIVRSVLGDGGEDEALRSEWARLSGMKTDADLMVIRAGDALDYHKGVLHEVTDRSVQFDFDGEVLAVRRSKVYGLVYHRGPEAELPPALCRIIDMAGSQWPAQSLALAAKLQWTTPAGLNMSAPLADVAKIDFSSGKLVYLGDLKPERVAWTPYFAGREPPPATKRFYAPRFDCGFDSLPLRLGGVEYRKGLALQSRTELVYRLPERFRRFVATAGIADAAPPGGKVRLVVQGDDRVLLETALGSREPPRSIDLDVTGVRRLTILLDFEKGHSAGGEVLLCNARVVK